MNGLTDAKREGNQQENKRGDNQPIPNSHQSMQENQKQASPQYNIFI